MPSQTSGGGSKANALAAMWDKKQKAADEDQKSNPFSSKFDSSAKLKKGDAGYGTAVAGSETAMRAKKAQEWVEKEIEKLLVVIAEHGYKDPTAATRSPSVRSSTRTPTSRTRWWAS